MASSRRSIDLHQACRDGNLGVINEILSGDHTDIDIGAKYDTSEWTLLQHASWDGYPDVVNALLHNGFQDIIDVNDGDGDTALHLGATKGHYDVCCILTDAGANVMAVNKNGNTAFHQACKLRNQAICAMLLGKGPESLNMKNKAKESSLLIAARHDCVEVCRTVLKEGADYSVTDEFGDTALHIAVTRSSIELVRLLVEIGPNCVSKMNKKDESPLHKAAERNNPDMCRILLECGSDHQLQNTSGNTAFHIAANANDSQPLKNASRIGRLLLDAGAKWDVKNNHGDGVLHIAARKVSVDICNMLVEKNANCLELNKAENAPWDLVPKASHFKLDQLKNATDQARYSRLMEQTGVTPVKTVKLFLCGDPKVGKTTLKKSLTTGRFASLIPRWTLFGEREHNPTPGINVKQKTVRGAGDFVIWDMAGQIEYHVTHAMMLGASNGVFIVVFDIMNEEKEEGIREQLMYWLKFIKAGHDPSAVRKPSIVVVGTHIDLLPEAARRTCQRVIQAQLDEIVKTFVEFLDIYKELIIINGRCARSDNLDTLKTVLTDRAKPFREVVTPSICAKIAKRMTSWGGKKYKLPVMEFPEFYKKVHAEIDTLADQQLVRLAVSYMHNTGELHCAKVKQYTDNAPPANDLIILNPNWLTTTIFGPIFASSEFSKRFSGLESKQLYTLTDLKSHLGFNGNTDLLVDLLEYFELTYRRDKENFIIPAKLPAKTEEIAWRDHHNYSHHYGLRIECRDITDMFTVDTFPCLQVRAMNRYKKQNVDPKLSRHGLKLFDVVEGMIQLTKAKEAIHIAVRVKKGCDERQGTKQLDEMKDMVFFELKERSIGTRVNVCYLSPQGLQSSTDLVDNVQYYRQDILNEAKENGEDLVNPVTMQSETVESVVGIVDKDVFDTIESLDQSHYVTDDVTITEHDILVTEEGIQQLSQEIGEEWERLARFLGITAAELFGLKQNYRDNVNEQIFQMLMKWRNRQSKKVDKVTELKKAFAKSERLDLAYGKSESSRLLSDKILESVIQKLHRQQWEILAICLGCTREEVFRCRQESAATGTSPSNLFTKWRRRQPRNTNVVKFMIDGLKYINRKDVAHGLAELANEH